MMSTISKEEYLKKYLSPANGDKTKKKKRKKLKTVQGRGMKIIDDDVKLEDPTQNEDDELKFLVDDEKPLIENVDARTEEEKELDEYRRSKMWRAMGAPEEEDVTSRLGGNSGKKRKKQQRKKRYDSDSDVEVQRRRKPG
uniref:BUD13 homolog n=1 Tax=Ciona savignyi TaxID=51511 RepID=H2Y6M2_CIOSA